MSSPFRRLHGLFSSNSAAAKAATTKVAKSITPPAKPTASPSTIPTTDLPKPSIRKIAQTYTPQDLVRKFKKNSNSDRFRRHFPYYDSTVRRLAAAGQHPLIQDILEHQKNFKDITDERFVVGLILLYGKVGMFDNAHKLFDEMPELKCERTVFSFNALLAACVNAKKFDEIEELFRELPDKLGIQPDIVSYNTVIKAFCHMGSLDKATQVVELMESNGIAPNVISFNTLINAYYRENRIDEGDKLWGVMESKNVIPDVRTYNPKLRVLVVDTRIAEAVELMEEMKSKGVKPDMYSYNWLIKGYCDDKNLEEAKRWYGEITKNELVPDRVTFDTLIPFMCDMADFEFALELCKEAINLKRRISIVSMQHVVDGLVKELNVDEAQKLVDLANSKNYFQYKLKISVDM